MILSTRTILVALLIVGLAASLLVGVQRFRVEQGNKAVELVLDYTEVEDLAAAQDADVAGLLGTFRLAGATSVAVTEQTIADAVEQYLLVPKGGNVFEGSALVVSRAAAYLNLLRIETTVEIIEPEYGVVRSRIHLPADMSPNYVNQLPIGVPETALYAAGEADMEVIARVANFPGARTETIDAVIKNIKAHGINKIVFDGDQVLGFKQAVEATADALVQNQVHFGQVEFAKQKGEKKLAKNAPANTIVVHSITQGEMSTLDAASIVERFQKAVKERGVRICYVRLYDTVSDDVLETNLAYVASIAQGIRSAGFGLRSSRPYTEIDAPTASKTLAGVGAAAGAMLLVLALFSLSNTAATVWSTAAVLICGLLAGAGPMGQKMVALLAAVVFPTMAIVNASHGTPSEPAKVKAVVPRTVGRLALAALTSGAGAALIAGLLSQRDFMLRVDQFAGVKLAHILPLLLLAAIFAGTIAWKQDTWAVQKTRMREAFKRLGQSPVLIWQAAGILVVLILVGLMVARSGNDSGIGVGGLELKFRSMLDRLLLVRPRTKEILIGYPVLAAGIAFALRGYRRWAAPLMVVGSIGLVSSVNSFCHIHTPLALSILRTINGAVVGTVIGLLLYWLVRNLPGKEA